MRSVTLFVQHRLKIDGLPSQADEKGSMFQQINLKAGVRHESNYLHQLECLRGVAILLVFLFHVYGISYGKASGKPTLLESYVTGGNTGVTLFFVLSGFLLSLPWLKYLAAGQVGERPSVRSFYKARALRVLPLYELAVAFSVLMTGAYLVGAKAAAFMFVGFEIFPYSVVWWTLSTEIQFYVLLPLGFWAWSRSAWTRRLLLGVLLLWAVFYTYLVLLQRLPADELGYFYTKSLFGRLPAFLVGILAARLYIILKSPILAYVDRSGLRLLASVVFMVLLLGLGLVLQACTTIGDAEVERSWHIHHTWEALLWAGMLLCLVLAKPWGERLLLNRPFAIVGKLSYSLYLVHVPILFYLIYPAKETVGAEVYSNSLEAIAYPLLALALSLGLSLLTYRFIELPFLNLKKRIPS